VRKETAYDLWRVSSDAPPQALSHAHGAKAVSEAADSSVASSAAPQWPPASCRAKLRSIGTFVCSLPWQGAPSLLKFMSILLTVVGAVVMLNPTNMALSAANLCFLARALCLAAYLSLQAPLLNHLSAITVTTIAQVLIRSHVAVNDTERALESLRIYCRRPG
jgi:hypothetical protein